MNAVRRDPREVLRIAAQLSSHDLFSLSTGAWALGYGEAVRMGDAAAEKGLEQARRVDPASLEVFRRFVVGDAASLEDAWLTPEVRAAACFVRSRNTALSGGGAAAAAGTSPAGQLVPRSDQHRHGLLGSMSR